MIIDMQRFIERRRANWDELEQLCSAYQDKEGKGWPVDRIERMDRLYRRACSDLAQAQSFAADRQIVAYLERLVGRAYGIIYQRRRKMDWRSALWLFPVGFPRSFRRQFRFFLAASAALLLGAALGGYLVASDAYAKDVLFRGFEHLMGDPSERVAAEEQMADREGGGYATFSSMLMANNIRVSILALALGMLWGVGTIVLLFYNGGILGAVCIDYIRAGEAEFLAAWLLPHGVVEIPAILLGGMAGLMLAQAMLGWGDARSMADRLRAIQKDVTHIVAGLVVLLIWAGLVESYLSQTHEPAISYEAKILFGVAELVALALFLGFCGRKRRLAGQKEAGT